MKGKQKEAQEVQTVSTTAEAGNSAKNAGVSQNTVAAAEFKRKTADPAVQMTDRMRR